MSHSEEEHIVVDKMLQSGPEMADYKPSSDPTIFVDAFAAAGPRPGVIRLEMLDTVSGGFVCRGVFIMTTETAMGLAKTIADAVQELAKNIAEMKAAREEQGNSRSH